MISLALKRCPPLICFQRNLMPFLLDYKSALIKREWISCDDISWLTQILMERIKWVWLIDSQAAKQSHHQSLLTHLLTRSLTRSIHQSINESMDGSRDTLHPLNITFVTARKLTVGFVCVLSEIQCYLLIYSFWFELLQATDIYLSYTALLTQKNIRYIYYSQN